MSNLENLKVELLAAKASIEPQIEGLHDFARLNLQPDTLTIVNAAITDFERRLELIVEAIAALDALEQDGYPALDTRQVTESVFNDLKANVDTIEAAFEKFAPADEAVAGTITPGIPTEKP